MGASVRPSQLTFPVWTLLICALTVLIYLLPSLRTGLIYDTTAIARGEWWRLVTGNPVHLSPSHLVYNLAAFLVAGSLLEMRRHPHFVLLSLSSALMIGVALYLMQPTLDFYGGLSGVVIALVVYLCLHGMKEKSRWGWLCRATLAAVSLKAIYELVFGESLLRAVTLQPFVLVPLSHATGLATALLLFLATNWWGSLKGKIGSHGPHY